MRFLYFFSTLALAGIAARPLLNTGECSVQALNGVNRISATFRCQVAAIGAYLSEKMETIKLVRAPDTHMLGCIAYSVHDHMHLKNTGIIVRRGECSFQQKLAHVAATGATLMILINSDNTLISLSSLEYEKMNAAALSIAHNDGEMLVSMITDQNDVELKVEKMSFMMQARIRLRYLMDINAPVVYVGEFYNVIEHFEPVVGTLDDLLALIAAEEYKFRKAFQSNVSLTEVRDFFSSSAQYLSKWTFANEATLYATIAAAVLQIQLWNENSIPRSHRNRSHLLTAAQSLMESGYYSHGASLLRQFVNPIETQTDLSVLCLFLFLKFLQGDLITAFSDASLCKNLNIDPGISSLRVAQNTFNRLIQLKRSNHDKMCLKFLTRPDNDTNIALICCDAEDPARANTGLISHQFSSPFTNELFHSSVLMGVFLDELGSFQQSLSFFKIAARICQIHEITLELRQLLAIPIVFSSQAKMNNFFMNLLTKVHTFSHNLLREQNTREMMVSSVDEDIFRVIKTYSRVRPEYAAYLDYTITPSTMFIGYQGQDVLPLQKAIYKLRSIAYPSLLSSFDPHKNNLVRSDYDPKRRRVAFISSWFRSHSVGKLLLGVIQNLDRSKFQIFIYHCVHFLYDADDMTAAFNRAADIFENLPSRQDAAVQLLRQAQLDIVIFPELGMDEWTVLLSHHRVAPIQCVFWGHPITTGNPHIDYFISSEHFVSRKFDDPIEKTTSNQLSEYRRAAFSEQIVLFRGLGTIFTKPKSLTLEANAISRSRLFLPTNRRLYVCPQTLMKLHPAFDEALDRILNRDHKATIVLIASETQFVWMEQLRRRFRQRFGRNHRRVLFLRTLPFDDYQALLTHADVVLDPFPFGGGVTTLDVLHLGIPVVTLPTAQSIVHLAAGFLRYMNASDCIAHSLDEYVQLAVHFATDHQEIRQRLLRHRSDIYQDDSTIEDWNKFLATVAPRIV
ncbi:O-linked N-acetylglucosamine transferase OGT [Plasmopara halstedii]|uniref:O-linked N-acetylglucosamine transferase OGT n=1 Tax=Plasmopara halstedii TaxID=4781 RepID=A0A0P1ASL1_PLAHL|nr:O-linked N-acetylglucosamine transferase OGT [Plasmopara halstedii]CEG44938.1 O-linked N-acetylglucosamine transferase OGT [Plasmopara halstedii]|eukprot:XP_024581307.1 O-linked N-acetylglucosamine transferase OGT [Plasmopara halstedii]